MSEFRWDNVALFQGFDPEDLDKIKGLFSTLGVEDGTKIITEGEQGDEMYILVKGRVRITKAMLIPGMSIPLQELNNPRKVLATLDGEHSPIFGEMALLDSDTRSATVEAVLPSEFLVTDRERFFAFITREPVLGCRLLAVLGRRLAAAVRKNNSDLVKLTTALALALSRTKR